MPDDVTVNRKQLLDILKANKAEHRTQFEAALRGWEKRVTEELERALEDARAGRQYNVIFSLPRPSDHTDTYDRAIAMMEMEVRDEVVLGEREFAQMVLDDWGWKPDFVLTNASYTG